jgi:hypothetical protein
LAGLPRYTSADRAAEAPQFSLEAMSLWGKSFSGGRHWPAPSRSVPQFCAEKWGSFFQRNQIYTDCLDLSAIKSTQIVQAYRRSRAPLWEAIATTLERGSQGQLDLAA